MSATVRPAVSPAWHWFFMLAAVYDIGLGLAFLVGGDAILEAIGMQVPPHVAYFQLAAVFVLVQGISYLFAWHDPVANRGIIWVGVIYKAAYSGLAAWYLALGLLPSVFFVPWAVADLLFMIGFLWFLLKTSRGPAT
jgi:hypothetical protein